ncbi:hypothetical protein Acor_80600 [Acrocarpospora corrugata]|uniref:Uncharacterized protein n=1 Tax=Acrocarpospora corrugata TaxID=35763 RepID=A0A5M3WFY6_9ACTN|nr:hypothetical protein Acor_80600 [Acrocarpospora corrugata]
MSGAGLAAISLDCVGRQGAPVRVRIEAVERRGGCLYGPVASYIPASAPASEG